MCSVKVAGGLDGINRGYTPPPAALAAVHLRRWRNW